VIEGRVEVADEEAQGPGISGMRQIVEAGLPPVDRDFADGRIRVRRDDLDRIGSRR
jgi:hypothetical protein